MTQTYFWESQAGNGKFTAADDQSAISEASKLPELMILYREADTVDGTPFVVLIDG